jgi:hypothetical protein
MTSSPVTHPIITEGYAYWLRKRGDRPLPARTDLDPSDIKRVLPHVMLVDVVGPRHYRYRLVGTACVCAHGVDVTGLTLDAALKDDKYRDHVVGLYDQCVDERRPLYSESLFFFEPGSEAERHVKVMFMPLSADGAAVNMVFTVQVIEFMNDAVRNQHLTSVRPHAEIARVVL